MKKYFLILILMIFFFGCSKEDDHKPPIDEEDLVEETNLPPKKFEIDLLDISDNSARIGWSEAIDPENEKVTYTVLLNNEIKLEDTHDTEFEFSHLSELTNYTGSVIAKDENGNETIGELQFSTEKYYIKFLKEYYYENTETDSSVVPSHMIETSEGDYVITGSSTRKDGGSQSFALKIDKEGNEIWKYSYGNEVHQITNVTQTLDGGFLLVAYHMILKIDANGNEIWRTANQDYVHPDYSFLITLGEMYSVKEDSQGNIFVVGWRGEANPDPEISHFGVLTKISSSGEILWEKEFRDSYRSTFDDLVIDADDNIIIYGTADTDESEAEKIDFWLLKTDNSGEVLWKRTLYSYGYAFARKIVKIRDNNYAMVGFSWGGYDIGSGAIFKITPDGDEIWSSQISLSSVLDVSETSDGGFITIGHIDGSNSDFLGISRLSSGGTEEWTRSYIQSFTHLRGKAILETEDQGFIFTVSSFKNYYNNGERPKILVFKTDPEGNYE